MRVHCSYNLTMALCLLAAALLGVAHAGVRDQAKRIHDRLAGVPPSAAVLDSMAAKLMAGDAIGAAYEAMQNSAFFNVKLKDWVAPWTNAQQSQRVPLNDYTATVIGMIRDEVPFNAVLSADLIYVGAPGVVQEAYSHADNRHYQQLEQAQVDLGDPTKLVAMRQSDLPGTVLPAEATAGVITTRQAAQSYFTAGTNRAMLRFMSLNYLCRDMEDLHDISRAPDRVRQDVTRSPEGDSSIFLSQCSGCHSGMDALAGAYAYYDFNDQTGRIEYTAGQVQQKYLSDAHNFPRGYVTVDDRWDNYWRSGPNSRLGWRGPNSGGYGAKSLGEELSLSRAFSICQVEKVFQTVCLRQPANLSERMEVQRIADVFEVNSYSMKRVFAETAVYCKGH